MDYLNSAIYEAIPQRPPHPSPSQMHVAELDRMHNIWTTNELSQNSTSRPRMRTLSEDIRSSMGNNRSAELDYASPHSAPSSYIHRPSETYSTHIQSPSEGFNQLESSIGPDRVLTRRQRASTERSALGRRASMSSAFTRTSSDPTVRLPLPLNMKSAS